MAAESIRDLKRRIRSVQSTRQITRAMEMVAAAKLRRAQARLFAARPYAQTMREMLANLAAAAGDLGHPLLSPRPAGTAARTGIFVFAGDRGLAGSYNANVVRAAELRLREAAADGVRLVLVGKKSVDYFRRRRYSIHARHLDVMGGLSVEAANALAQAAADLFLSGEVREVDILYTSYVSTTTYRVTWERLLPIAPPKASADATGTRLDYIFEPDAGTILAALLPRYLATRILMAMAEAQTAEHGSRMISMSAATKNAGELIDALILRRNRARQAAITKELAEIVGGAEALK